MAKKPFDLGDYLKAEPVSGLNTEQIVRIPLERIDPDPNNFYSLQGIEELAGNIELVGLLDALRVRPEGQRYVVVSGHRRRAACMMIRDGGNPMFDAGIPCIVEYGEASPAMRELRLIYANAATRVMSAADLSRQAERVTELLYQLKEQGVEFPGRMRDHVAQACQVSASKIARLHAIRGNLIGVLLDKFDAGHLKEATAYLLSQQTPEMQENVWRSCGISISGVAAETAGEIIDQIKKRDEPKSEPGQGSPYRGREAVEEYLAKRAEEDADFRELLLGTSEEFIRKLNGVCTRQDGIDMLKSSFGACRASWWNGGPVVSCSPKGVELAGNGHCISRTWTETYDVLCTIALNRAAMRLDEEDEAEADDETRVLRINTGEAAWQTGTPERNGRYYCRIRFADSPEDGGRVHEQRGEWRDGGWWFFGEPEKYGIQVVGWWPLPDEERWK